MRKEHLNWVSWVRKGFNSIICYCSQEATTDTFIAQMIQRCEHALWIEARGLAKACSCGGQTRVPVTHAQWGSGGTGGQEGSAEESCKAGYEGKSELHTVFTGDWTKTTGHGQSRKGSGAKASPGGTTERKHQQTQAAEGHAEPEAELKLGLESSLVKWEHLCNKWKLRKGVWRNRKKTSMWDWTVWSRN